MNYRKILKDNILDRMFEYKSRKHICRTEVNRAIVDDMIKIVYQEYYKPLPEAEEGSLDYNQQNWKDVLETLNLYEDKPDCYGVTHILARPQYSCTTFHYESEEQKRDLYLYLAGMAHARTAQKIISNCLL